MASATPIYEHSGGPVRSGVAIYVDRPVDERLHRYLSDQRNLVLLTAPRQSGKSSLVMGLATRLRAEGQVVPFLDFRTAVGSVDEENCQPNRWFERLLLRLCLTDDLRRTGITATAFHAWWQEVKPLSRPDRVVTFFGDFLRRFTDRPMTICFDEIDMVGAHGFHTDDLFEAIRNLAGDRDRLDLSFLLAGLNHPGQLLKTRPEAAFNIGKFESLPLFPCDKPTAQAWGVGLDLPDDARLAVALEVLRQSGGQPYLTALLFHEAVEARADSPAAVQAIAAKLVVDVRAGIRREMHFDAPGSIIRHHPNHAFRALALLWDLRRGPVPESHMDRALGQVLRSSGLITVRDGRIEIISPLYRAYFDEDWIAAEQAALDYHGTIRRTYVPGDRAQERKPICVVNTGGTIGMELLPDGRMGQPPDLQRFFQSFPDIYDVAEIDPLPLMCKDGINMVPEDWRLIARAIYDRRKRGYAGFVVCHGTDSMVYTASAVAYALGPGLNFPVVFTGAQVPRHVPHSDAPANLLRACVLASRGDIPEVAIFYNDGIFRAVRTEKKDDFRLDGFHSPTYLPLGVVTEKIELQRGLIRIPDKRGIECRADFERNIFKIAYVPGLNPGLILPVLDDKGLKGIVIQTPGVGNMPTLDGYSLMPVIRAATERHIPTLITSQIPIRSELANAYQPAAAPLEQGAISAGNMAEPAAIVKFMWLLSQVEREIERQDIDVVDRISRLKELMTNDVVGEIDSPAIS